jgi:hypothetical protein
MVYNPEKQVFDNSVFELRPFCERDIYYPKINFGTIYTSSNTGFIPIPYLFIRTI